jgi:hypothetical protein
MVARGGALAQPLETKTIDLAKSPGGAKESFAPPGLHNQSAICRQGFRFAPPLATIGRRSAANRLT